MIPRLKLRTEFSYRRCFGRVTAVAERLKEIGATHGGIVDDDGTWGHIQWETACLANGVEPLFGTSFTFETEDGRRPRSWVLATDTRALYRLSSRPPESPSLMAEAKGVVRFAGAALSDPETFDYVDINHRSRRLAHAAVKLAEHTGKPLVLAPENDYPHPDDLMRFLAWDNSQRIGPQYIMTDEELMDIYSWVPDLKTVIMNTHEVAERLSGQRLPRAPIIQVPGDLNVDVEQGRQYRLNAGHIKEWTSAYQERLEYELSMIAEKQFESYFLVVGDMVRWAKQNMLVGPARGSSAGSLVCYLTRITEVDPLVHDLLFERFIDVNRADLPDIDIDFSDERRHLVFEYMTEKYGADNVARLGNISRLKSRSVLAHVGKKMAIPPSDTFAVTNVLIEYSSGDSRYGKGLEDTLNNTSPGRNFMKKYPEAAVMGDLENHASHTSVHAAGLLVSTEPVVEYCTVRDGIAHVDKMDAEALNLLKIDALGLRTLGVIEDANVMTSEELYALPLDDPAALAVFNEQRYSGLFQFEGASQRRVSQQIDINDFKRIDHVTALARPGPLGGGATNSYVNRAKGRERIEYVHPSMELYLGDTQGVVIYQEQIMRIVREIGDFDWSETSYIRKAMSGRKGAEYFSKMGDKFVEGAAKHGVPHGAAVELWQSLCNFGAWGMNKSHTCSYAVISYWCAYLKAHFPLEYAAALLRHAKDDEQTIEVLRELAAEGVEYVPFDLATSGEHWRAVDGRVIGGFRNIVGVGEVKAATLRQARDEGTLTEKQLDTLAKAEVKFTELNPTKLRWGDMYENPKKYQIMSPVREFAELEDGDNAVVIGQIRSLTRRDENEAIRVNRRGKMFEGQSQFLDIYATDDSVSKPVTLRLRPELWRSHGEKIADRAVADKDWLLVRGRWLGDFNMMIVKKVKCLTNEELLD